jgi:hypothetical protein
MDKEKKIGALWLHVTKDGTKKYLSGKVDGKEIVVFKNGYKEEGSKQPDWIIYVSDKQEEGKPAPADGDAF